MWTGQHTLRHLPRIRSVPANSFDSTYCSVLGQMAVHGAMAGYSGITVLRLQDTLAGSTCWCVDIRILGVSCAPLCQVGKIYERYLPSLVKDTAHLSRCRGPTSEAEAIATCQFMPSPIRKANAASQERCSLFHHAHCAMLDSNVASASVIQKNARCEPQRSMVLPHAGVDKAAGLPP